VTGYRDHEPVIIGNFYGSAGLIPGVPPDTQRTSPMKITHLLIAAAGSALLAGSAMAQDQAAPAPMAPDQATPPASDQPVNPTPNTGAAPSPDQSTMAAPADQSTTGAAPAGQYNYNATATATQPASSTTLGDPAMMKAGDASVVSNGPVPDTPENRAKYGKPMSNAGKKSSPAGN